MLLGGGAEPGPRRSRARAEATGHVDRHGRLALTVRSARSKIDKLAALCKFRSFEYRESCTDGFNTRMLIELGLGRISTFVFSSKTGGRSEPGPGKD